MNLNFHSERLGLLQLAKVVEEILFIYEPQTEQFLYTSGICVKILGHSVKNLYSSQSWLNQVETQQRQKISLAWQRHLAGENFDQEYRLVNKKGERWLHSRFIYIQEQSQENFLIIIGIVKDITTEKRHLLSPQKLVSSKVDKVTQEASQLETQKQLLEKILHALPFSVFLKNRHSEFIFLNQTVIDAFGLQERHPSTIGYEELFSQDSSKFKQDDQIVWNTGESLIKEETFTLDGEVRNLVLGRTLIQPTANVEDSLLLSYAIDTTLQKQAERALTESEEKSMLRSYETKT